MTIIIEHPDIENILSNEKKTNSKSMYVPKGQFQQNQRRLLEFAFKESDDFKPLYSPDARTEKYFNASKPILLNNFTITGNGLGQTDSCGKFQGLKTCPHHPHQTIRTNYEQL